MQALIAEKIVSLINGLNEYNIQDKFFDGMAYFISFLCSSYTTAYRNFFLTF